MLMSDSFSMAQKPHYDTRTDQKSAACVSTSSTYPKEGETMRALFVMCCSQHLHQRSLSSGRCHPPLFHNFKWFNIKAALVHHPFFQKEVDELLARVAIEP